MRRPLLASALAATAASVLACAMLAPAAHADDAPAPSPAPTTAPPSDPAAPPVTPAVEPPATPAAPQSRPSSRLPLHVGASGWRVTHVQDRLAWLGYEIFPANRRDASYGRSTADAVTRFQSKYGFRPTGVVGPGTYDLLDQIAGRVGWLPASCLGERTICVDKRQKLVRLVEKDRVVLTLDARFGMVGAETREGTFRVNSKSRYHISTLYQTSMPFALFFSGGQAVHYSPYFARDGYSGASHGCVNLRDYDRARWLFDRVPVGTRVTVYRS